MNETCKDCGGAITEEFFTVHKKCMCMEPGTYGGEMDEYVTTSHELEEQRA
jgi:hypothetical protein